MKHGEQAREEVERATAAALKALARRADIVVGFAPQGAGRIGPDEMSLPAPDLPLSAVSFSVLRGTADGLALSLRYHDEGIHERAAPRGREARAVFDALEQVRVEVIGARRFAGVASNVDARVRARCEEFERVDAREDVPPQEALALVVRERLSGHVPSTAAGRVTTLWRSWIEQRAQRLLETLESTLYDQQAFADTAAAMIDSLGIAGDEAATEPQPEPRQSPETPGRPDVRAGAPGAEPPDDDTESDAGSDEPPVPRDGEPAGPHDDIPVEATPDASPRPYAVFSRAGDEELSADTLCAAEELARLRGNLDRQLRPLHAVVSRLANQLQRRLLATQNRHWEFDLEEGILDSARLCRVITDPLHPLSFKRESDTAFRDTVVTLLIDNSGSMRGRPITVAAISADILARTLERCGVKVEILGFTTRAWKGGSAREKWVAENKPANAGRLNDLRHIV